MNQPDARSTPPNPIVVALVVAIICALGVSLAAVALRPYYLANLDAARVARLGSLVEALNRSGLDVKPEDIEAVAVDLESGELDSSVNPLVYDARTAVLDPTTSIAIPSAKDVAGMKRRENHAVVYFAKDENSETAALIIPIWGVGYQSAIYGYLALAPDAQEILALKIYEHGETPGLGSRIQDRDWEDQWPGKQAFNDTGEVSIHIGGGDPANRVDAISGATRTSMGVDGMLRFWLGELGFARFLQNFRTQGVES